MLILKLKDFNIFILDWEYILPTYAKPWVSSLLLGRNRYIMGSSWYHTKKLKLTSVKNFQFALQDLSMVYLWYNLEVLSCLLSCYLINNFIVHCCFSCPLKCSLQNHQSYLYDMKSVLQVIVLPEELSLQLEGKAETVRGTSLRTSALSVPIAFCTTAFGSVSSGYHDCQRFACSIDFYCFASSF